MISRVRLLSLPLFVLALIGAACSKSPLQSDSASPGKSGARPTIVFMTDFGTANDAVAICKAVMLSIAPDARIMDITHRVTPYSIEEGARFLEAVSAYYPAGTVFVAVIDPGVGTSRKAVIVKSKKGQYFVLPDNGLSSTFHGRDIFSPAAAHLAAGWDFNIVGPEVPQLVRLTLKTSAANDNGVAGDIIALDDPFGSLVTDIPGEEFKKLGYSLGDKLRVEINKKPVILSYAKTFMDVPVGDSLLFIDSRDRVSIAVNQGSYSKKFNVEPPGNIFIPRKGLPFKAK